MNQPTKARSLQKRDAGTKLAQHRLSVLELAKKWGTSPKPVGSGG